ncbi:MAG: MotA/TolQ/ExbB proton channel family protein [Deltaproteobacteria bacterium]|nr:MotA/TolQ/ExbB proton channel family protein [Deltaproteobacteria bacterium]
MRIAGTEPASAVDPLRLVTDASGPGRVVLALLVVASFAVWVIWLLKWLQLGRLRSLQAAFEREAVPLAESSELVALALRHEGAAGARVVLELARRQHLPNLSAELLKATARRAIVTEEQRAGSLMPTLASIASAAPFVGLFGTVWGIMEAFLRIGLEKSASLPVVAPAIGEALIATAVGLVAAIPATIAYNYVDRRIGDFLAELTAAADTWVELMAASPASPSQAMPLVRPSSFPPGGGG